MVEPTTCTESTCGAISSCTVAASAGRQRARAESRRGDDDAACRVIPARPTGSRRSTPEVVCATTPTRFTSGDLRAGNGRSGWIDNLALDLGGREAGGKKQAEGQQA